MFLEINKTPQPQQQTQIQPITTNIIQPTTTNQIPKTIVCKTCNNMYKKPFLQPYYWYQKFGYCSSDCYITKVENRLNTFETFAKKVDEYLTKVLPNRIENSVKDYKNALTENKSSIKSIELRIEKVETNLKKVINHLIKQGQTIKDSKLR